MSDRSMRFKTTIRAGENERFSPTAFVGQVGTEIPIRLPAAGEKPGKLISVTVAADGQSAELVLEVSDVVDEFIRDYGGGRLPIGMSVGFRPSRIEMAAVVAEHLNPEWRP